MRDPNPVHNPVPKIFRTENAHTGYVTSAVLIPFLYAFCVRYRSPHGSVGIDDRARHVMWPVRTAAW